MEVAAATELFTRATSLGGVESLISVPALMTHASVPPDRKAAMGLTDGLVRLSVGVEDVADLLSDLEEALAFLQRAAAADDDGEIAAHLGEVYWARGWRDKAMKVWMAALQRDPENPYVVSTMERLQAK